MNPQPTDTAEIKFEIIAKIINALALTAQY